MSEYSSDALVDTEWLEERIDDPDIRILEVDEDTEAYSRGHIRNAVGIHWRDDLQDPFRRDFIAPEEFSKLMARFYGAAAEAIDDWDGMVDKFVGDGAVALFIPGFAGSDHAADAIAAARALLEQTGNADGAEPWIPVGAAVHTGMSFVGAIGEGDARDFTALGDTVNAAARLTGLAGAGEILISVDTAGAAGLDTSRLERRTLELRGRDQSIDAWVARSTDVRLRDGGR
jgi:class 3 adenylate cyclase